MVTKSERKCFALLVRDNTLTNSPTVSFHSPRLKLTPIKNASPLQQLEDTTQIKFVYNDKLKA
ncbi:MAG TPA: hypothetical protein V6D14_17915, partial [Coleofasciculaceae cyanobacterium]